MGYLCITMRQLLFVLTIMISKITMASDFEKAFADLENKFNEKIKAEKVEDDISVISEFKMRHTNYELTPGTFVVFAPERETLTKEELKIIDAKQASAVYNNYFRRNSAGTGFFYKGYVITNFHVCRGKDTVARDHDGKLMSLKLMAYDPKQDICILYSEVAKSRYPDFAQAMTEVNEDSKDQKVTDRKLATTTNLKSPVKKAVDLYRIHSMWGAFDTTDLKKDTKDDEFSKKNAYVTQDKKGRCVPGISGSPMVGPKGFQGIIWGSTSSDDMASQVSGEKECFLIDKSEIDKIIAQIDEN